MASLRLQLAVDVINAPVPSFPFAARRDFDEAAGFEYQQADGVTADLPIAHIETPQVIALTVDQEATVDLGAITLQAGGFILVYAGTLATNPPTVDNASGETATIRGVALGA